ncbi:MAG: hypothetical protein JWQ43_1918 [Glaciihabitans sp.]|nr:hypothetical protein [Glaciihabitans sp.]
MAGSEAYTDTSGELVTGEAVALDLRPTGFVLRAAGTAIDWVLYLGGYVLLVLFVLPFIAASLNLDDSTVAAVAVASLVLMLVGVPTTVELLTHGKSLGRLAVGARIVRDDGGAIGFRHAFIRSLTGMLELFITLGGLAAVVALLNGKAKRLGDLLAGTYSQYERASKEIIPVYGVPLQLVEWAATADVARMPDRVSRRIASYLRQAPRLTPETRLRLGRELAAEASLWVSPLPEVDAELFLAAVAAIRRSRESAALQLEQDHLEALRPALAGLPHGFPDRS